MLDVILWVCFGTLVGWTASMLDESSRTRARIASNIVVGLTGAVLSGLVIQRLGGTADDLSLGSIPLSIVGSIVLLCVYNSIPSARR